MEVLPLPPYLCGNLSLQDIGVTAVILAAGLIEDLTGAVMQRTL